MGTADAIQSVPLPNARRTLALAGVSHALHDGYTDAIYVLLPLWQSEFALGYGALALLRALNTGTMAVLQIPAGRMAGRFGGRTLLALGTALAAIGYGLAGFSGGLTALAAALALSGAGSSTQHPLASAAVARSYGGSSRGPLGTYNFAGDLGKAALPALVSLLLLAMSWRHAMGLLALLGMLVALAINAYMPKFAGTAQRPEISASGKRRGGFALLLAIGVVDTGVRMGFLMFLPFLLRAKAAPMPLVGLALALVFMGGAGGKFIFGWLGARMGLLSVVLITELATAVAIGAVILLPLGGAMLLLPFLGIMLNGTSSVLYGTVPELAAPGRGEHAFALFYTGTIGSGALSPVLFGLIGDAAGAAWGAAAAAGAALLACPLALLLAPRLRT